MKKITAIIPAHGRFPLLKHTIDRLFTRNGVHNVVVVGNGSEERELSIPASFDLRTLPKGILKHISTTVTDRNEYKQYNFKKWKIVIWLLVKMNMLPVSMYKKYCC